MKAPTANQRAVLEFIETFTRENGFPPTMREISENRGLAGPSGATFIVDALVRKGFLRRMSRTPRGLKVVGSSEDMMGDVIALCRTSGFAGQVHELIEWLKERLSR